MIGLSETTAYQYHGRSTLYVCHSRGRICSIRCSVVHSKSKKISWRIQVPEAKKNDQAPYKIS